MHPNSSRHALRKHRLTTGDGQEDTSKEVIVPGAHKHWRIVKTATARATHNIHRTAREGSKARKIPGWVVMFIMPVTPSNSIQTNVTEF